MAGVSERRYQKQSGYPNTGRTGKVIHMALIMTFLGELSGKLNGSVFARNRGGTYVRKWAKPTNPNTPAQQLIRTVMSNLVIAWQTILTQLQRDNWATYAANVPFVNRLGAEIFLTGQNHYIRSNSPRVNVGLVRVDDAPTPFNLGTLNPVSVAASAAIGDIDIIFDDSQAWVNEDGAGMIVQRSFQMPVTRNFYKGPFTNLAVIEGQVILPPSSPESRPAAETLVAGNKLFLRVRLSQADGRLSSPQIVSGIIAG